VIATTDGVGIRATWARRGIAPNVYDGALVPGGDLLEPLGDPTFLQLLAQLGARNDVVVGAIGTGVVLLGAAGLLRGRRIAHPLQPDTATPEQVATLGHYLQGAIDAGEDVVGDGPLLTAVSSARVEFARRMVSGLEAAAS
jgi:putative intracellular protease/amidase